MEKKINKSCGLVGSSKIAKIHARELIKNKIKDVYFISRNIKKSKFISEEFNKEYNSNTKYSNHTIFKLKKFDLIDICSNTKFHEKHLENIAHLKTRVIIEKPIILIKKQKNFESILDKIYKKNKNIFVSYPMFYLAKFFKKKFRFDKKKINKIKKIKVYYQTRGKHESRNIFLDLAPHAFSFILSLLNINSDKIDLKIGKIISKSKNFLCTGLLNNINFEIHFIQDVNESASIFKFAINEYKAERITKIKGKKFLNYLKYRGKTLIVANPMSEVIKYFLQKDYKKNYRKNKSLTYLVTKLTQEIYDKSF